MKRTLVLVALTIIATTAISGAGILSRGPDRSSDSAAPRLPVGTAPPTEEAISFFADRVRQNPQDAVGLTLLGQLHSLRARETGDVTSFERAEIALERALDLLPHSAPAGAALAEVYYAEHRFGDALRLARRVHRASPGTTQALATIGDAYLALGAYRKANEAYGALRDLGPKPPALARGAQLAWLHGRTERAIELMERAALASVEAGETGERASWYEVRLGDLEFGRGRLDAAEFHYRRAMSIFDGSYQALAGLGRVHAAQGRFTEAIGLYERAVSVVPQPDLVAALGDLYAITGRPELADERYELVEAIGSLAASNRQVYDRQLAMFYADHDGNLDAALDLAMAEIEVRKDVFGYDALAWTLHKNDRNREAARAIEEALRLGTRDASLFFHAGMIYDALGREARAMRFLERSLALNPGFSPLQAGTARSTLERLMAG
jgi:tetratricopeptide (TPR) repeat protein